MGQTWYGGLQFRKPDPPVLEASIPTLQHLYALSSEAKAMGLIGRKSLSYGDKIHHPHVE